MSTLDILRDIIRANESIFELDSEEIVLEASLFEDLGLDSLDLIELSMDIEDRFAIQVSDDELRSVVTVADVVALIEKKSKAVAHG